MSNPFVKQGQEGLCSQFRTSWGACGPEHVITKGITKNAGTEIAGSRGGVVVALNSS